MLFTPTVFIAGGSLLAIALIDKTAEAYGFQGLGLTLRIIVPIVAMIAGVYFLETNAILRWL